MILRISRHVGELDVVEDAAAQEGVGQLLLVVRGDEHHRALRAAISSPVSMMVKRISSSSRSRSFGNSRSALSISSMSSTWRSLGGERLAERTELDVAADVGDVAGAEAAVVQALHGVVDVEPVGRLRRRLDVPRQHRHAEAVGDVARQHGLAGARLALQQQRPLEGDGAVDRVHQRPRGDVAGGALEARKVPVGAHPVSILPSPGGEPDMGIVPLRALQANRRRRDEIDSPRTPPL